MKKKLKPKPAKKTSRKKGPKKSPPARKASAPKKKAAKKKAGAKAPPKPGVIAPPKSALLGYVEDYFAKIGVVALTLKAPVNVGDKIRVKGHTTDYTQMLDSMQIEHAPVTTANKGDSIGIKVIDRARRTDRVYKVS